jgi:uncharacterized membrane-anchored protein YhcB (DUF1043 family)
LVDLLKFLATQQPNQGELMRQAWTVTFMAVGCSGLLIGDQLQGQEQRQADQQQIDSNQAELDRQRRELERPKKQAEY